MTKAIVIGDVLCLHISSIFTNEYIIEDIAIYITENGNYEIGLFFEDTDGPIPYWQFLDLNKAGMFWKKGQEEIMGVIRKNRLV